MENSSNSKNHGEMFPLVKPPRMGSKEKHPAVQQQMHRQNVALTDGGILLSLKQEGHSDTCYHMDDPAHYTK